jgi:hypothetical protein
MLESNSSELGVAKLESNSSDFDSVAQGNDRGDTSTPRDGTCRVCSLNITRGTLLNNKVTKVTNIS